MATGKEDANSKKHGLQSAKQIGNNHLSGKQKVFVKTEIVWPKRVAAPAARQLADIVQTKTVQEILFNRGITTKEEFLDIHFAPIEYENNIFDLKTAASKILKHIKNKSKIVIYGDYDADGILATAILWDFLYRTLQYKNIDIYIPSRIEEGYGLNDSALATLKKQKANLIITVDCGITSGNLIKKWQKKELDFVITDHHTPPPKWPEATVVHPMHPKSTLSNKETTGAFVAWKLVGALTQQAIRDGFIPSKISHESELYKNIDLVATSIITDVMPVIGVNKTIVKEGLHKLQTNPNTGLKELYFIATNKDIRNQELSSYDLGFIIGPRLNAAGRLEDPLDALRLVSTTNNIFAKKIARKLHNLNATRQTITTQSTEYANNNICIIDNKIAIAYKEDFNEGIIGLIAGRLTQQLGIPCIVLTKENSGKLKASARSPEDFHITEFFHTIEKALEKFGGHAQAGGFTTKDIEYNHFVQCIKDSIQTHYSNYQPTKTIKIDATLYKESLDTILADLSLLAPWGPKNHEPLLNLEDTIESIKTDQNNKHTFITTTTGLKLIYWNNTDLFLKPVTYIKAIGTLRKNQKFGNTEFIIKRLINN